MKFWTNALKGETRDRQTDRRIDTYTQTHAHTYTNTATENGTLSVQSFLVDVEERADDKKNA